MEIKVLGTGCAGCKVLHETVKQVVAELKLAATVVKEEDIMKIMSYNVMALPALVLLMNHVSAAMIMSETTMERNVSIETLREVRTPGSAAVKNCAPLSVTMRNGGMPSTTDVKFCAAEPKISSARFW